VTQTKKRANFFGHALKFVFSATNIQYEAAALSHKRGTASQPTANLSSYPSQCHVALISSVPHPVDGGGLAAPSQAQLLGRRERPRGRVPRVAVPRDVSRGGAADTSGEPPTAHALGQQGGHGVVLRHAPRVPAGGARLLHRQGLKEEPRSRH
jgi:hypothetical protein